MSNKQKVIEASILYWRQKLYFCREGTEERAAVERLLAQDELDLANWLKRKGDYNV